MVLRLLKFNFSEKQDLSSPLVFAVLMTYSLAIESVGSSWRWAVIKIGIPLVTRY